MPRLICFRWAHTHPVCFVMSWLKSTCLFGGKNALKSFVIRYLHVLPALKAFSNALRINKSIERIIRLDEVPRQVRLTSVDRSITVRTLR